MKKIIIFLVMLCFSCSISFADTEKIDLEYKGTYSGTFSGTDSGTWTATIASTGKITGTVTSILSGKLAVTGQGLSSGAISLGNVSSGATFTGMINLTTGATSGTWVNTFYGDSGIFSGAIIILPSSLDCLFNWAEITFPQYFSPAGAISSTSKPYYYRYYTSADTYLAVSSIDNNVYVLGGFFGNTPLKVGFVSNFLSISGCL